MKTIFKNGEYKRVSDEVAEKKVKEGWKFTSKSEWKEKVRDAEKAKVKDKEQHSAEESIAKKEKAQDKMNKSIKNPKK